MGGEQYRMMHSEGGSYLNHSHKLTSMHIRRELNAKFFIPSWISIGENVKFGDQVCSEDMTYLGRISANMQPAKSKKPALLENW